MSYTTENIRNVALAGHPGAGKTMLFEALLHAGGAIQTAGSIERGTTVSDFDPIEKERGHSIEAAIASIDTATDNMPSNAPCTASIRTHAVMREMPSTAKFVSTTPRRRGSISARIADYCSKRTRPSADSAAPPAM